MDWTAQIAPSYFNNRKVSIYGGSNEIQRNIITKAVLGLSVARRRRTLSSWPGLTRPSTCSTLRQKAVDARVEPGHDERIFD